MGELQYPPNDKEWAKRKGIILTCSKHNLPYDPWIGCPKCIQERAAEQQAAGKPDSSGTDNPPQADATKVCPYCGSPKVYYNAHFSSWKCAGCEKSFTFFCLCGNCLHGKKEYCSEIWSPSATSCHYFVHRDSEHFRPGEPNEKHSQHTTSSQLQECPQCKAKSLFWDKYHSLFECLNPDCRKTFSEDESGQKVPRNTQSRETEKQESPAGVEESLGSSTGPPKTRSNTAKYFRILLLIPLVVVGIVLLVGYNRSDHQPPTSASKLIRTTSDNNCMPTFTWAAATDTGSGVKSYLVRLDNGDWANTGAVTTYMGGPVCDGNHTLSVRAVDKAGNKGPTADLVFTCAIPPVISQVRVSEVTETTATIEWATDEPSTSRVSYGPDASCSTTSANNSALVTTHTVPIAGLEPGMTYHYRTVSSDAKGNQTTSPAQTFETPWVGPNGEHETETLPVRGATHTITLHSNPDAADPTWSQLLTFLANDRTDWHTYDYGSFVCADYAEVLHNNAEIAGIRAGYVTLGLDGNPFAHAANVFNTTDRGLIYVDDTRPIGSYPCSADKTVVVSVGQQYIPQSISPCPGYSSTFLSMGTVTGVTPYW